MTATIIERASPSTPALAVRGLSTQPAQGRGAEAVTLQVAPRHVTVLLGPPGSGKSALLRAIAGLDRLRQGRVQVGGRDVATLAPHQRGVGLVLQKPALFPRLSVADNIRFGLRVARWRSAERELRVAELGRAVGLGRRGDAHIDELSAGEQLGVAIARAIALGPRLLMLDEPLAAIPTSERARERSALRQLLERLQLAVLTATCDVEDAMALATDLAVMAGGSLLQHGPVDEVAVHPASADVARILGYVAVLDGRAAGDRVTELGVGALPLPAGAPREGRLEVFAHPAGLLAVPAGRGLGIGVSGAVVASWPLGPFWQVEVLLGERQPLLARWEWDEQPPASGTPVDLVAPAAGLHFFARAAPATTTAPQEVRRETALEEPRRLAETG